MSLQKLEGPFQVSGWEHAPMSIATARALLAQELERMVTYGRGAHMTNRALRALRVFTGILSEGPKAQYPNGMPPEAVNAVRATLELIRLEAMHIERHVNRKEQEYQEHQKARELQPETEPEDAAQ